MLKYKISISVLFFPLMLLAQDIVKNSNYSLRDFIIKNDSLYYLEHTELRLFDFKNNTNLNCFVGGFGLEFYELSDSEILTVANELVKNVSSFRFYDKKSNTITESFFYKKGKVIDFAKIPELNVFAFSATNKKIIFINFDDRKNLKKIIEIKLDAFSRRLVFKNKELFYCTDSGKIFRYSMNDYKNELIYKTNAILTDFNFIDDNLVYSTIDGDIVKVDLKSKKEQKLKLTNNFVLNSLRHDGNLICGSWKGTIYVIDLEEFKVAKEFNYHEAAVLKISYYKDSIFYSSSIDKTIKKWIIK
ncbi:MAG: hypothetical protein R2797_02360 [Gelidibacter sp.]